jgi:hypothetical protein
MVPAQCFGVRTQNKRTVHGLLGLFLLVVDQTGNVLKYVLAFEIYTLIGSRPL